MVRKNQKYVVSTGILLLIVIGVIWLLFSPSALGDATLKLPFGWRLAALTAESGMFVVTSPDFTSKEIIDGQYPNEIEMGTFATVLTQAGLNFNQSSFAKFEACSPLELQGSCTIDSTAGISSYPAVIKRVTSVSSNAKTIYLNRYTIFKDEKILDIKVYSVDENQLNAFQKSVSGLKIK